MNVSIIIPNYNGEKLLKKNLPGILNAAGFFKTKTENKVEIIVVDDASTDASIEEIKKINAELKIIKNEKNLGFASTVNKGVREAKGDIVVLLNTDVVPEKDFLISLLEHFNDSKIFAVGCMDKSIEDSKEILRGRGIGKWERGFLMHSRGDVNKNNTLWVSGGSGAFRKELWEKLGGLNTIYNPFYWEDIDLSYRALKSGYKILFDSKSVVIHEHLAGAIKTKYKHKTVNRIAYRNQFIFVWLNVTDFGIFVSHIFWLPYHMLKAIERFDTSFFLGFFDALILFPKVIKSRLKTEKLFVKTDNDVIREI